MKKSFLLLVSFMALFGVFAISGAVFASQAELLQPAEEVTYNEDLRVNGTGRFSSVYIGEQGIGGVTFFNGTIVNSTTNDGADNPVTFGDGVRIDGEIWRTEKGGDNPLKISDHVMPTLHDTNDMGIEGHAWRNMYYSDTLHGGSADLSGDLDVAGVATIRDTLTAVGTVTVGGGYGDSGITLHSNGDMEMDADLTVDGTTTVHGDIDQDRNNGGAVKALVVINSAICNSGTPSDPMRSWTYNGSTPTCTSSGAGTYTVDFNFTVSDRFWQVTPILIDTMSNANNNGNDKIQVDLTTNDGSTGKASPFMLTIY